MNSLYWTLFNDKSGNVIYYQNKKYNSHDSEIDPLEYY